MIEEKVKDILKKYRNLEQKKDWKNQKLLGNDLKFSARDLINVYVELEKEFDTINEQIPKSAQNS